MEEHIQRITEISEALKNTSDPQEKERLTREFWLLAKDAFNTHIAGPFETADGRTIETPELEI